MKEILFGIQWLSLRLEKNRLFFLNVQALEAGCKEKKENEMLKRSKTWIGVAEEKLAST